MRHFLGYGNAVPLKLLSGRFIFWKSLKEVGRLGLPDPNTIGWTHPSIQEKLLFELERAVIKSIPENPM